MAVRKTSGLSRTTHRGLIARSRLGRDHGGTCGRAWRLPQLLDLPLLINASSRSRIPIITSRYRFWKTVIFLTFLAGAAGALVVLAAASLTREAGAVLDRRCQLRVSSDTDSTLKKGTMGPANNHHSLTTILCPTLHRR